MSAPKNWGLPRSLGAAVERELDRLGHAARPLEVTRRWAEAVGPTVARNAWPARMRRDGTLVVHASSSVWSHELTQLGEEIRARLGSAAPVRLQFVVGPIPDIPDATAASSPDTDGPAGISRQATPSEQNEARKMASGIEDLALRDAVSRAIAATLATRRCARPV